MTTKIHIKYKILKSPFNLSNYSGLHYVANLTWETALKYKDSFYNTKPEFNFETEHGFIYIKAKGTLR